MKGIIDGHPLEATFMPMGNGTQMLPVKAETLKLIGKETGDTVAAVLKERVSE